MAKEVIVEIDTYTGEVTYEVNGVVGSKCSDITSVLTANKKVISQELKDEYNDQQKMPDWVYSD